MPLRNVLLSNTTEIGIYYLGNITGMVLSVIEPTFDSYLHSEQWFSQEVPSKDMSGFEIPKMMNK